MSELRLPAGPKRADRAAARPFLVEHPGGTEHGGDRRTRVRRRPARRLRARGANPPCGSRSRKRSSAGLLRATYERRHGGYVFAHEEIADVLIEAIPRDRNAAAARASGVSARAPRSDRAGEIALHFDAAGEKPDAYHAAQLAAEDGGAGLRAPTARRAVPADCRHETPPRPASSRRFACRWLMSPKPAADSTRSRSYATWQSSGSTDSRDERRAFTLRRMRERARMELGQPARKTLEAMLRARRRSAATGFRSRARRDSAHDVADARPARRSAHGGAHCERGRGHGGDDRRFRAAHRCADPPGQRAVQRGARPRAHAIYSRALVLSERTATRAAGAVVWRTSASPRNSSRGSTRRSKRTVARSPSRVPAECRTCWGLAALNLGVLSQRCGDYDRARELFAEALGLFAAVKHSEYQLAALFNMAHVERELGLWESAAELYEATIPLAQRIGQADIEIGAIAGAGLCALELGRIDGRARGDRSDSGADQRAAGLVSGA